MQTFAISSMFARVWKNDEQKMCVKEKWGMSGGGTARSATGYIET